jgi:hypothetical protein
MITEKLSELNNLESYDDDSENKLGDMLCANTDYIYWKCKKMWVTSLLWVQQTAENLMNETINHMI